MTGGMTKGERQELSQLVRKRERVMKCHAQERSAALLAEFDAQSAKIYSFDDEAVWQQAQAAAEEAVTKANEAVQRRCKELGIIEEFAPGFSFHWHGRGHNAVAGRRAELRRAAKSKIEALEKEAVSKIERMSLEAQTQVIASGLESEAAKKFLDSMPSMETLMPAVHVGEMQELVESRRTQQRLEYMH